MRLRPFGTRPPQSVRLLELNPYHEPPGSSQGGRFARRPAGAPIPTNSVKQAARLIAEGKKVSLRQPRQVSTLLTRLAAMAQDAAARGEKAPNYDLCKVTVRGTNLFCAQNRGVPRIEMPQFKSKPRPGSEADKLPRDKNGEVNGAEAFQQHLARMGVRVTPGTEKAEYLRASQTELIGANVAWMMTNKSYDPARSPILVSSDNYVLDGHHNWAATVGRDAMDGRLGDLSMNILRVDMPIDQLLEESKRWTDEFGLLPKGAG